MYIKRKLEDKILRYLKEKEILAIVGPRQSGKTTLLKRIQENLKDSIYLTFEDLGVLELFEKDIKKFAITFKDYRYLFIDEFQYARAGGKNLKYLYDTRPELKIIISGSSAIDLTVKAIKFLVGRIFVLDLYQLDFGEYLSGVDSQLFSYYRKATTENISPAINEKLFKALEDFIIWGGYPRIATVADKEIKQEILKNIYNTYFLRDIKDTLGLIDDFALSKLIEILSLSSGQLVDYQELSKSSGYDFKTLKKYLNILEKTFICQSVRPYFQNKRTEIVKNPKIYFFDTGLRNYALKNFHGLSGRGDKGSLAENFVYSQFFKTGLKANFWRSKNKAEVDFIARLNGSFIPIEIKSGNEDNIPDGLKSFINKYRPESAYVLNREIIKDREFEHCRIKFRPLWFPLSA